MNYILLLVIAAAGLAQQTPQLSIIPNQLGTPGVLNLYERRSNGTSYVTLQAGDAIATSCAFSLTDVSILPCANNQVDIGSSALRFKKMWAQDADINAGLTVGGNAGFSGNILFSGTMNPLFSGLGTIGTAGLPYGTVNGLHLVAQTDFRLGSSSTAGYCLTADASGFGTWQSCGAGASLPVADTSAIVFDNGDVTKLMRFEVGGFTTGTTRVFTPQNADYTLAGINIAQTFTANQTFNSNLLFTPNNTWNVGSDLFRPALIYSVNADFAPSGIVGNTTNVRKLNIADGLGGAGFWDVQALSNSSSSFSIRDNAGSKAVRLVRTNLGSPVNYLEMYGELRPVRRQIANGDAVDDAVRPSIGNSTDRWTKAWLTDLDTTTLNVGGNSAFSGNILFSGTMNPLFSGLGTIGTAGQPYGAGYFNNLTVSGTCTGCTMPDATQFVRGAVNTSTQNFGGQKTFYGSILPGATNTYSNGTNSLRWFEVWANTGGFQTMSSVNASFTTITIGTIQGVFAGTGFVGTAGSPIGNGYFSNLNTSAFGNTTINVGSGEIRVASGNFYNRTFGGAPSCGGVTDGWTGVDTFNLRIWVCIGGTARYATLF